jgi:hypothetical protein
MRRFVSAANSRAVASRSALFRATIATLDVSFDLSQGELALVAGPSGSGKRRRRPKTRPRRACRRACRHRRRCRRLRNRPRPRRDNSASGSSRPGGTRPARARLSPAGYPSWRSSASQGSRRSNPSRT